MLHRIIMWPEFWELNSPLHSNTVSSLTLDNQVQCLLSLHLLKFPPILRCCSFLQTQNLPITLKVNTKMYDLYCRLNNIVESICSLEVHQSVETRQTKLNNAFNERTSKSPYLLIHIGKRINKKSHNPQEY